MSTSAITLASRRQIGRSVLAVVAAIITNAVLSLAVDQIFHSLGVYPPWGETMKEPGLYLLALGYRCIFGVVAGYLVARLAPSAPMRHAQILGVIATLLATVGVVAALTHPELGPAWYPILLAILSYPTILLGATLLVRRTHNR